MSSYWTKRRKLNENVDKQMATIEQDRLKLNTCDEKNVCHDSDTDSGENKTNTLSQGWCTSDEAKETPGVLDGKMEELHSDSETEADQQIDLEENAEILVDESEDSFEGLVLVSGSEEALSGSESDSETESPCNDLADQLAAWATSFSVSNSSLAALLVLLRQKHPELPKDPRTLLGTLSSTETHGNILEVSGGSYYHFGISNGVKSALECRNPGNQIRELSIQVNIDGAPVFKSTSGQFWPIQGMINKPFLGEPFLIGLYYGECKPTNLEFWDAFVREYHDLKQSEIEHAGSYIGLDISVFVCDAPARAFIKHVKPHMGYSNCERCTQGGVWNGKMTFPELNAPLRSDVSFDELRDDQHHVGPTPLSDLGIGLVSQVVLDYMHLVCLGVMRRLIFLWMKGPLHVRQGQAVISTISATLKQFKDCIPSEFPRRPRSLREVARWKATEFRQFLLYTGLVSLSGQLPNAMYDNFLLLTVSMHILLHQTWCHEYNDFCQKSTLAVCRSLLRIIWCKYGSI